MYFEMKWFWAEAVMTYFKEFACIHIKDLRKTMKTLSG
jgi:hypothetical protein